MILPHTVTVYNVVKETDATTFTETTTNYMTVLSNVLLDASKGANVRQSGLVSADAVTLYIPINVTAVDAVTGNAKTYVEPMEFWAAEDKTDKWTLSTDKNTFFVKGNVVEAGKSVEYISMKHSGVYDVSKVDEKDFGGLAHWEVGGV